MFSTDDDCDFVVLFLKNFLTFNLISHCTMLEKSNWESSTFNFVQICIWHYAFERRKKCSCHQPSLHKGKKSELVRSSFPWISQFEESAMNIHILNWLNCKISALYGLLCNYCLATLIPFFWGFFLIFCEPGPGGNPGVVQFTLEASMWDY